MTRPETRESSVSTFDLYLTFFLDRDDTHQDIMSAVINDVRTVMNQANAKQMNLNEILRKLQKVNHARYNQKDFKKDNILEVFNYYKKLQVVFMDQEENVVFL
jgi:hypothetical protein